MVFTEQHPEAADATQRKKTKKIQSRFYRGTSITWTFNLNFKFYTNLKNIWSKQSQILVSFDQYLLWWSLWHVSKCTTEHWIIPLKMIQTEYQSQGCPVGLVLVCFFFCFELFLLLFAAITKWLVIRSWSSHRPHDKGNRKMALSEFNSFQRFQIMVFQPIKIFLKNGAASIAMLHSNALEVKSGNAFCKWMVPKMVENLPPCDHVFERRYTIGWAKHHHRHQHWQFYKNSVTLPRIHKSNNSVILLFIDPGWSKRIIIVSEKPPSYYDQHYHHNYYCNHHYHHWYFFCHTRKTLFLTSEKEVQVARKRGRGNSGNAQNKTFIFMGGLP